MEIDRRNLLTGLVATSTAAAILPALPASAAVADASRFCFPNGVIISDPTFAQWIPRRLMLGSLWHFDPNHGGPWLIRHVPTGLTCRQAPQDGDRFALQAVSIDAENADWPEVALKFVGWAARLVAPHASLVLGCRPWHEGAVFFHYPQVTVIRVILTIFHLPRTRRRRRRFHRQARLAEIGLCFLPT